MKEKRKLCNLYEHFKRYAVSAESVENFCDRYHRRCAFHERGTDYMKIDIESHNAELKKYGYTIIPQGSSTTGDIVAFYR